ncbi:MAG TPA: YbaK/EbsC family protein [Synergistaceae bacterium]|nr:YbaK/EbsC family protein [Synergistaceae bacterium]HPJ24556.1 YbaK/EbsC family protein [Synergistaceae bacterium]HPQ36313.1 YbaK/EbsC family protein [Synergistaceae bacterium]
MSNVATSLVEPVEKVRNRLDELGYEGEIVFSRETIFTVEDASQAVGVPPEEILKTLVLLVDDSPVLVLLSGINRVHLKKVKALLGAKKVKMCSPEFVYEYSGFQVGGVPPLGYPEELPALLDEDLFLYHTVWAAAGTDHAFFPVSPEKLREYTRGNKGDLKK